MSPAAPRAAFVQDWLTGMRGGEKVLAAMLPLLPEAPIFTLFHLPGSVDADIEARRIETSFLQRAPGLRRHYRRYLPLFPAAAEDLDLAGYDLVVSTSHCVAKGVIPPPGSFHLCYCHTPMRYVWDQERVYFPRRRGPLGVVRRLVLGRLRAWDVLSSSRVDRFLANSRFVAARIRRYYGRRAEVVPPPVDTGFFTPDGSRRRPFALMIAALSPYKRIEVAMEACRRLGLELRVVGDGPERRRLARRAGRGAVFLGRVPASELRTLYRTAELFLQPGVEDFGISSVEALGCGAPVVALGRGGVLDVVEHGVHGVLYDDVGDDGIEALMTAIDRARQIRFNPDELRHRAEAFSVARFQEEMRRQLARRGAVARRART